MSEVKDRAKPKESANNPVDALLESYRDLSGAMEHIRSYHLPNREKVASILRLMQELLFPGYMDRSLIRATDTELREHIAGMMDELRRNLELQMYRGLHHQVQREREEVELDCPDCAKKSKMITDAFLADFVRLRELLVLDVQAHYECDPAATGYDEIIFCYPGLYAITVFRIAHALHTLGARLIPRIMSSLAHERVGIDIHPGAQIGFSFFIDHGTGVVIGETTEIGKNVRIYQGVTLGALSLNKREGKGKKRHPTIGNDVVIYAGATVLGGNTIIGDGATIGGNAWVTKSLKAGETRLAKEQGTYSCFESS